MMSQKQSDPTEQHDHMLTQCAPGSIVKLQCFEGNGEVKIRLISLGLLPGEVFRVVRNQTRGPLVIQVKHSRLLLGRGLASKVRVAIMSCTQK